MSFFNSVNIRIHYLQKNFRHYTETLLKHIFAYQHIKLGKHVKTCTNFRRVKFSDCFILGHFFVQNKNHLKFVASNVYSRTKKTNSSLLFRQLALKFCLPRTEGCFSVITVFCDFSLQKTCLSPLPIDK